MFFFPLKLLKLGEIDDVKFLAWKSDGVNFWTNSMSEKKICDCRPLSSYNNNAVNASCQSNLRRRRDIKLLLSKEIPFYFVLITVFLCVSPHILLNNFFMAWKEPFLYFPFFLLQVVMEWKEFIFTFFTIHKARIIEFQAEEISFMQTLSDGPKTK